MSFRLDAETKRKLEALANKLGVSRTDVLVLLIREKAKREGVS